MRKEFYISEEQRKQVEAILQEKSEDRDYSLSIATYSPCKSAVFVSPEQAQALIPYLTKDCTVQNGRTRVQRILENGKISTRILNKCNIKFTTEANRLVSFSTEDDLNGSFDYID
jgi:hypothetical protein